MDEEMFEYYTEWANDELVWGKGMYNWCRAYSREEWEKPSIFKQEDDDIEIPF